jgi:arylsulfatase A-like enzyme
MEIAMKFNIYIFVGRDFEPMRVKGQIKNFDSEAEAEEFAKNRWFEADEQRAVRKGEWKVAYAQ